MLLEAAEAAAAELRASACALSDGRGSVRPAVSYVEALLVTCSPSRAAEAEAEEEVDSSGTSTEKCCCASVLLRRPYAK